MRAISLPLPPIPLQHEVEGCTDYQGDTEISVAGTEGCATWCSWVPVLAWHYPEGCASCGLKVGEPFQEPKTSVSHASPGAGES